MKYQQQIFNLETSKEEELNILEKALERNLLSIENYESLVLAIKEKYAKKVEDLEKKRLELTTKTIENEYDLKIQDIIARGEENLKKMNLKAFFSEAYESIAKMQEEIQSTYDVTDPLYSDLMNKLSILADEVQRIAERITDIIINAGANYGETIGEMIAEGELSMKSFLKETVLMALDTLERIIEITCLEVMVKNIAATVPFSFIGAAKGAMQVAAIKAMFAATKGLISNFYTGGYTDGGDWDEPKGVVHSNEFVANRFAVANPAVRPVLDLIDVAQRTGSIDNLSSDDIAAVTGKSDFSPVTVVSSPVPVPDHGSDDEVKFLIIECSRLMKQMRERLKEPLIARTYANGKGGTMEAEELVNKMKRNAQRRR